MGLQTLQTRTPVKLAVALSARWAGDTLSAAWLPSLTTGEAPRLPLLPAAVSAELHLADWLPLESPSS